MVSETLREVTSGLDDGRYSIVSTLKEGRLYLAEKAGKRFVLKTAEGARGLELLKREYEIAARLQHPYIASALGWEDSTPIGPAIVIEYIRGRSLSSFLQEKPSTQSRRRIFAQLLEAVGAMHRQSIIHNDIKPDNILITEADNDIKFIDFGFADADAYILEKSLGGTRQYASPELLAHRETDARSDIYSIGRLMQDIFPGRYRLIARKCLQTSPDKRYRNIDELKVAWAHRQRPLWVASVLSLATLALGIYYLFNIHIDKPDSVQVESTEVEPRQSGIQPVPESQRAGSSQTSDSNTALSKAEETLREAWENSFVRVCEEMDQAGYREFLPIHIDYGTYGIDPLVRQVTSGLSAEELQTITSLNDALYLDYSQRLYAKYGTLPSLYDRAIDLPADELKYYRNLAAGFRKFSPFSQKDIK